MARSVYQGYPSPYGGEWVNSTVYPGWMWKRDTSADEVTGHMMVICNWMMMIDLVGVSFGL